MRNRISTVALALGVATSFADDTKLKVKEGDKFPSVELTAVQADKVKKDTKTLSIDDLKGKNVVVFFYPKAMTPGCTVESCGFRDALADFLVALRRLCIMSKARLILVGSSEYLVQFMKGFVPAFFRLGDRGFNPVIAWDEKRVGRAHRGVACL